MTFDDAVTQLFRAPHDEFVNERKRLATELRATDKPGAAKLNKFTRPPISAWAVNQLWWNERADFEALLSVARRVRDGELAALADHKAALAKLVKKASDLLVAVGNAAAEATLRRVEQSLSTIAVAGGFSPDADGALTDDREPPGFASLGIPTVSSAAPPEGERVEKKGDGREAEVRKQAEDAARALAEAAARARAEIDAHARAEAEARENLRARLEAEEQARMLRELEAAKAKLEEENRQRVKDAEEAARAQAEAETRRRAEAEAKAQRELEAERAAAAARAKEQLEAATQAERERLRQEDERRLAKAEVSRLRGEVARLTGELARTHTALVEAERRLDELA